MFGILGHTLRGGVDWNNHSYLLLIFPNVTPCVGVWIETVMDKGTVITEKVTPCVGVWIETLFTRWSSLWKNCKHSASCVFLFKLL